MDLPLRPNYRGGQLVVEYATVCFRSQEDCGPVDALRPHTQVIWQQLDLDSRWRFFRHVRPYWECHRHRAAPAALDIKEAMEKAGRLHCCQGRVERIFEDENALFVNFRDRSRISRTLAVNLVVNCTGPE
jgi:uncharacterized NAD(P)/FAD-binding protein YdhS